MTTTMTTAMTTTMTMTALERWWHPNLILALTMLLQRPSAPSPASHCTSLTLSLKAELAAGHFAAAEAMILRGGSPTAHYQARNTDLGGPAKPPPPIYRIASMTKLVTSVTALQCIEEGHFTLSTPIYKWIPELAAVPVLQDE